MDETLLKRPIKTGSQYNKYFGSQCESIFLGNGDTALSISIMAKWVNKYKHQCKELAQNEFANLSLENTAAKIYAFLYNHLQYKLDGDNQKIRSPFCSWLDRQIGIDCKSYSVIASCCLSELGIVHYLRKTKQLGYEENSFTHVYVAIPVNQKTNNLKEGYYIIDATLHNNYEVPFLEAKDKLMSKVGLPHYGLGFSATSQESACSCNTTNMQPLGIPLNILPNSVELFKKFLLKLENKGVSRQVTQQALTNLQMALQQGKDPQLKDLFQTSSGLGIGLNPNAFFGLSGPSQTGETEGETPGEENDYLNDVLENIDTDGWFEGTFGAVFGNGWNFSCWGSSYNPTKGQDDAQRLIKLAIQRIQNPPSAASFNEWNRFIHEQIGYAATAYWNTGLAKCSRDGYKLLRDLLKEHKSQTFAALRSSGYVFNTVQENVIVRNSNGSIEPFIQENAQNFKYTTYNMVAPQNGGIITLPTNPIGNTNTPINNNTGVDDEPQQAGVGKVLGITTLVLLVANYAYKKYKKA